MTQERRRSIEQDDVDFVRAKSLSGETSQFELQSKPGGRIKPRFVPHGDINVR